MKAREPGNFLSQAVLPTIKTVQHCPSIPHRYTIMSSPPPSPSTVSSHSFPFREIDLSADPTVDELDIFTLPSPSSQTALFPTIKIPIPPSPAHIRSPWTTQYYYPPIPRAPSPTTCQISIARLNSYQQRSFDLPVWLLRHEPYPPAPLHGHLTASSTGLGLVYIHSVWRRNNQNTFFRCISEDDEEFLLVAQTRWTRIEDQHEDHHWIQLWTWSWATYLKTCLIPFFS